MSSDRSLRKARAGLPMHPTVMECAICGKPGSLSREGILSAHFPKGGKASLCLGSLKSHREELLKVHSVAKGRTDHLLSLLEDELGETRKRLAELEERIKRLRAEQALREAEMLRLHKLEEGAPATERF